MENTALNGTTNATKNQEWKTKKGYGPIIVAASLALLLGLSFYAGRQVSGANLREMGMTNAAAASSSTSLVGSGTAASDLKTLTIVVDDDELIDGLLSVKPKGGSSAYCKKNTGYNCGAVFPPDGDTCDQKGCCCTQDNGTGLKLNSCDSAKGYAYRGCDSCWGSDVCFKTSNINVGTSSCRGSEACRFVSDSTIGNDSCHGSKACKSVQSSIIHDGSCRGGYPSLGTNSCKSVQRSTIHDGSCHGSFSCYEIENATIGKGSCNEHSESSFDPAVSVDYVYSCGYVVNVKIGNNSCNGKKVCYKCKHNVPDNACNQGITDDMDINGFCNYCM